MGRKNSNVHQKNVLLKSRRQRFDWEKGPSTISKIVCVTGKTGYSTASAAEDKLQRIAQFHADTPQSNRDIPIRAYYHDACGSWHVTHQPQHTY
jgi:hypothetical protein